MSFVIFRKGYTGELARDNLPRQPRDTTQACDATPPSVPSSSLLQRNSEGTTGSSSAILQLQATPPGETNPTQCERDLSQLRHALSLESAHVARLESALEAKEAQIRNMERRYEEETRAEPVRSAMKVAQQSEPLEAQTSQQQQWTDLI